MASFVGPRLATELGAAELIKSWNLGFFATNPKSVQRARDRIRKVKPIGPAAQPMPAKPLRCSHFVAEPTSLPGLAGCAGDGGKFVPRPLLGLTLSFRIIFVEIIASTLPVVACQPSAHHI